MAKTIDNTDDQIDVRDVIAEFEDLAGQIDALKGKKTKKAKAKRAELQDAIKPLQDLLADLRGYGGDEQWNGDWYPVGLIRDSYWVEYTQQFAEDIGAADSDAKWPHDCIDWERAARELQMDYSSVEFDGITYWYR